MTTVTETRPPQAVDASKEAIDKLKEGLSQNKPWFIALLEAMALWTLPEETRAGERYCYVVGGEAFDWLRLAERLLQEVDGEVPKSDVEALLFHGRIPVELDLAQLRRLLGGEKYRAYVSYFYGVLVEEALILAVTEEVRKKWLCRGFTDPDEAVMDEVFQALYSAPVRELWDRFCNEKHFRRRRQISLHQLKEFTYWLFKRRLGLWDKARVASDTKKGLQNLHGQRNARGATGCR